MSYTASLLAISEAVWTRHLGPLLNVEQVRIVIKVDSRQAVYGLAKQGQLLSLDASGGRKLYPAFQFDQNGRPHPEITGVIQIFAAAVETTYTIASCFVSPQDILDGETAAAWMRSGRDPKLLLEGARRTASRLTQ